MYEIFCKYSYDYYFPHTIKEVFKEVFKEYTTRARDLIFRYWIQYFDWYITEVYRREFMEFIKYPYAKRGTKLNYNPYRYKNGEIY